MSIGDADRRAEEQARAVRMARRPGLVPAARAEPTAPSSSPRVDAEAIRARWAAVSQPATWTNCGPDRIHDGCPVVRTTDGRGGTYVCVTGTHVRGMADADAIAHAPSDIAALLADRDRLRADAARLDWLERAVAQSRQGVVMEFDATHGGLAVWEPLDGDVPDGWCLAKGAQSLRDAIDEARAALAGGAPDGR